MCYNLCEYGVDNEVLYNIPVPVSFSFYELPCELCATLTTRSYVKE